MVIKLLLVIILKVLVQLILGNTNTNINTNTNTSTNTYTNTNANTNTNTNTNSFWPIHPTLERLLQAKYIGGGFDTDDWPNDTNDGYICDKSTCYEYEYGKR